jgi:radical SAM-linked protein
MRIQITFRKTNAMRFTGHLDLLRAWERTFRRSGLPLAYSQGFNPRPKMSLSSALPLGFISDFELLDAHMESEIPLEEIMVDLERSLPPGIEIRQIIEVDRHAPPLQKLLIAAEYQVTFLDPFPQIVARIEKIIEAEELPRIRRNKPYNLRPLIEELQLIPNDEDGRQRLKMRLTAREGATGRPDEVVDQMGYDPQATLIIRTRLIFIEQ